jgi:hypothetical protein
MMPTIALTDTLSRHSVDWRISPETGRLFALDVVTGPNREDASQWVDVTGWTAGQVYIWLGY